MLFTGPITTAAQAFNLGPHIMKEIGKSRSTRIRTPQVIRVIKINSKSEFEVSNNV